MKQVLLKNFSTDIEAELAKNLLEEYDIKSVIQTEGRGITLPGKMGSATIY